MLMWARNSLVTVVHALSWWKTKLPLSYCSAACAKYVSWTPQNSTVVLTITFWLCGQIHNAQTIQKSRETTSIVLVTLCMWCNFFGIWHYRLFHCKTAFWCLTCGQGKKLAPTTGQMQVNLWNGVWSSHSVSNLDRKFNDRAFSWVIQLTYWCCWWQKYAFTAFSIRKTRRLGCHSAPH